MFAFANEDILSCPEHSMGSDDHIMIVFPSYDDSTSPKM